MKFKKILLIIRYKSLIISCLLFLFVVLLTLLLNAKSIEGKFSITKNSLSEKTARRPMLAIIIDDFGQDRSGVKEMMEIKCPLTFAVMPLLGFSVQDAKKAKENGFEVILHLPMQSQNYDNPKWLGTLPIKISQTDQQVKDIVVESTQSVPFAVGINIHMGEKASNDERMITNVMQIAKEKNIYFIDSRTNKKSICKAVANEIKINFDERNVFLESGSKRKQSVKKKLILASNIAIKKGKAIAIGHVGPAGGIATALAIKEMIPELEANGIEIVYVSQLFK